MQSVLSLPEEAKVIMLWETRSLECMPKCDPDEIIGRWYNDLSVHRDEDRVIQFWKKHGYTHILLNRNGVAFIRKYDSNAPPAEYWEGLQSTLEHLVPIEMAASGYQLYQIP